MMQMFISVAAGRSRPSCPVVRLGHLDGREVRRDVPRVGHRHHGGRRLERRARPDRPRAAVRAWQWFEADVHPGVSPERQRHVDRAGDDRLGARRGRGEGGAGTGAHEGDAQDAGAHERDEGTGQGHVVLLLRAGAPVSPLAPCRTTPGDHTTGRSTLAHGPGGPLLSSTAVRGGSTSSELMRSARAAPVRTHGRPAPPGDGAPRWRCDDQAFLVSQKISAISSIFAMRLSATAASSEPLVPPAPASLVASLNRPFSCGYFSKCGALK